MYRFRDEHGRVVYVGKAKNLRNRLNSYFAAPERLAPKTYAMVHTATSVEWTVVGSELESLQLEYTWIKEYKPRFNIAFRDDKSYPYLAVTMRDKFPRAQVMRGDRKKACGTSDPTRRCGQSVRRWMRYCGCSRCVPAHREYLNVPKHLGALPAGVYR